jgi:hypothetical protein
MNLCTSAAAENIATRKQMIGLRGDRSLLMTRIGAPVEGITHHRVYTICG